MIPIVDDETLEPREDFSVIFTPDVPGTETFTATVRILDNDQIGKFTITKFLLYTYIVKHKSCIIIILL